MELGRYRLDEQVGQGGMAVVWRGWDTQLRRTVAVKVLHAHLHARDEVRRRFDREAHAVARLHHPYILDVYDFSAEPGYLVTEFIRGVNLRAFADAHPFDPPELAAACLLPIAEALQHAHAAGVVHRDLKPENIMVRDDGVVKLTDFGIAALLDPDEKFTITGSILGSPAHLAPETIEGKPADPRADLFSFGTILYFLSTGKLPYQGASPAALLRNILEGKQQDPRMVRPSVSDAQARIIAKCLETDPAKRYQSAAEVKQELEQLLHDAGLNEPMRDLAEFVKAPEAHSAQVRERLVQRCLEQGDEQLKKRKTSAALAAFGRVLALDPSNARAKGQVERIRRRERLIKLAKRAALTAMGLLVVWVAGWEIRYAVQRARARAEQERISRQQREPPPPLVQPKPAEPPPVELKKPPQPAVKPKPPPVAAAEPAPISVKLTSRLPAHVTLDDRDLGTEQQFTVKLVPGVHRVTVRHPCCAELSQELRVSPNKTVYQLENGPPKPAEFKVIGAPAGARLLVDGVVVGTADNPPPFAMTTPDRKVKVTIGDRTLQTTLKAGMINTLDYAQATP